MEHKTSNRWKITNEDERKLIEQWRDKRILTQKSIKPYHEFLSHSFSFEAFKSFLQYINLMVLLNVVTSLVAVAIFQASDVSFDMSVNLLAIPIIFPLSFLINSNQNRREKVLEDMASFKSSGLLWYFSMREWKRVTGLDTNWINLVYRKLKNLSFHLREYVLTGNIKNRKVILRAMYEDFSDASLLIEKVRANKSPINTDIITRSTHLLHTMCKSMERLRVIREYRSPSSIGSFSRIFFIILSFILAPHFVHLGVQSNNNWAPYYIAIPVSLVFSVIQGIQDKLDDPFIGITEDDIALDTIEEWALHPFQHNPLRKYHVPRNYSQDIETSNIDPYGSVSYENVCGLWRTPLYNNNNSNNMENKSLNYHKYAPMFDGIKSITRIAKESIHKTYSEFIEDRSTQYRTNEQSSTSNSKSELPENSVPHGTYNKCDVVSPDHVSSTLETEKVSSSTSHNFLNSVEIEFAKEPINVDTPIKDGYGISFPTNTSDLPNTIQKNEKIDNNEIPDFIGHIKKFYSPYPLPNEFISTENTCWI